MGICTNCNHYLVCHYYDKNAEECNHFQDKANFVEVVHGRWIDAREYCGDYMCSNCDALYGTNKFNYCPNCGAKMDGERRATNEN